jgi:uncharacterized iron-regulated protein
MDTQRLAKQTLDVYRSNLLNTINTMVMFQEQNQKMVDMYLEQMTDLPNESVKAIRDWNDTFNKGVSDFKTCMDEGFRKTEEFLTKSTQQHRKR